MGSLQRNQTILLATSNQGKRREFQQLLPADIVILTLDDVNVALPPEDGATFAEIADSKASAASLQSGMLALADDSGLEVAALGGAPGIRSARYAGDPLSDERNRAALLAAMAGVPPSERAARFVCAVSLAHSGLVIARAQGVCTGTIGHAPAGENGFGYDPLFRLPNGRTMAELSDEEKNRVSHRAAAYRQLLPALLHELGMSDVRGEIA